MSTFSLSKKTDYALIAMTHLARQAGRLASARSIAEQYHAPVPLLTNVMKELAQAELVVSVRGARGGYQLARPVEQITLRQLIVAVEGPLQLVQCVPHLGESMTETESRQPACGMEGTCPIRFPVGKLQLRVIEFLDGLTLAELVEDCEGNQTRAASNEMQLTSKR